MHWFTPIKTARSKAERLRRAKEYERRGVTRTRKPLRIRPPNHVFFKTFSRTIYVNGISMKVCTRNAIANFFGVSNTTVCRWGDKGLLPEPFYFITVAGRGDVPVYLSSQVLVLRTVLADLVAQGYLTMPWAQLDEHIAMLKKGYIAAANRAYKKFEVTNDIEKPDRFGVVFY